MERKRLLNLPMSCKKSRTCLAPLCSSESSLEGGLVWTRQLPLNKDDLVRASAITDASGRGKLKGSKLACERIADAFFQALAITPTSKALSSLDRFLSIHQSLLINGNAK